MRDKSETKNKYYIWNFRNKEDGDTKEWEVRKEKCFEAEDEKFNCCYIGVETLIEYPGQMSSRKMQELGK